MLTAKEKSLLSALEPRAASEGVEIVTLEIVGLEEGADHPRLHRCGRRHQLRRAGLALRPGSGTSWTSWTRSPGPTCWRCPLRASTGRCARAEHFARFAGETVTVKTTGPIDGRSSLYRRASSASMDG